MKKAFSLILSLVIFALMLCGCQRDITDEPSVELTPTGITDEYSDLEGVRLFIPQSMFEPEAEEIEVIWVNETDKEIIFGEMFFIEKYTQKGWESVSAEGIAFNAIGYILSPNSRRAKTYSLKNYNTKSDGTYRFRSSCYVDSKECSLWTVFVVESDITQAPSQTSPQATQPTSVPEAYCGNTQTTIRIGDKAYTFMYGNSVTLTDFLVKLELNEPTCDCIPEYIVDTELVTGYGINLTEGYVRLGDSQTSLEADEIELIRKIIEEETSK